MENWHNLNIPEVFNNLGVKGKGLTSDEARNRLEKYGLNELTEGKKISPFTLFLNQFKSALIIILLVAVALSVTVGIINWDAGSGMPEEITDAIVILVIVIACVLLGFIEEFRSEKALDALKKMAAPTATVIRDAEEKEIPARELVPGDIVVLSTGDKIPADLRLIEVANLFTQEAPLTGESTTVEKTTGVINGIEVPLGDRKNMGYTGTSVNYGRGKGVVIDTGMQTEFGKIAKMLQDVEEEKTPLQKSLDRVGKLLGIASLILVVIIVGIQLIFVPGATGKLTELFIWGISLAVAAVPEALPAVVVISLAMGVQKMAKRNALVRRLSAVETLGSTTVICSDKTGTLTQDQMTARRIYVNEKFIDITGAGYEPKGEFLTGNQPFDISKDPSLEKFLQINALCNDTHLIHNDGKWQIKGDPTEGALLVIAAKAGLNQEKTNEESPRVDEIPFSSERKKMTTVHNTPKGKYAYSKGAPEIVLDSCTHVAANGQEIPINQAEKTKILDAARQMAESALRVLGTAYKKVDGITIKEHFENNMVFVGLVGMIDPPRLEAKEAIQVCKDAGIKTVMITGDHELTARAIARELGILKDGIAITGAELDKMSDTEYAQAVNKIEVYARVSPSHKLRVIEAFSKQGDIVAMTGDGVNDAPALKKADIGVAMGITGTDVSKEAAAMVLTDDNFKSIVAAVEEGRVIFNNIKKYLMYLLSSNLGEILVMAGAVILGPILGLPPGTVPLVAVQILLVNLITDGLPALALAVDPPDPGIMQQKPRPRGQGIFTRPVVTLMAVGGVWSGIINLGIFTWALNSGKNLIEAQSLCFLTLIVIQLFKAYNFRSEKISVFKIGIFRNKWLNLAVLSQVVLVLVIVEVPALQGIFNTFPLTFTEWISVTVLAGTIFPILEISKMFIRRQENKTAGR